MFSPMRRSNQQLSNVETLAILQRNRTAVMAVNGTEGYPYTVPINYVYLDGKLYFHGAKAGKKFACIQRDDRVSLCVVDMDQAVPERLTTYYRSTVVFGRVRLVEDTEEIRRAVEALCLRFNPDAAFVRKEVANGLSSVGCFAVTIEHMTGKEALDLAKQRNI